MEPSVISIIQHPLTALVTAAQLLDEDLAALPENQIRDRIAGLHRDAFWLHELVENVLCAATMREGQFRLHRQPVRIGDVVDEIAPAVAPILSQQGQRLETHADAATPEVSADARRLSQVMVNFISNASAHSAAGTLVEVRVVRNGDGVRVGVGDRGSWLSETAEDRPIEDLERRSNVHEWTHEPRGLGLAVARRIIEAHGGRSGASNRPAGGACFWFELPAAA